MKCLLILTIVPLKYPGNAHESLSFLCILIIDVFVCVNVFWTLPLNFSVDNVYFALHAGCVNRHVHVNVTDRTSCTWVQQYLLSRFSKCSFRHTEVGFVKPQDIFCTVRLIRQ